MKMTKILLSAVIVLSIAGFAPGVRDLVLPPGKGVVAVVVQLLELDFVQYLTCYCTQVHFTSLWYNGIASVIHLILLRL